MAAKFGRIQWLGTACAAALALAAATPALAQRAPQPRWADIYGLDSYEWIDRADAMSEAIGEAPPDTAFAAAGTEPWAWRMQDGSLLIVEQRGDGLYSYYFDANADAPFLVRGPEGSVAFLEGAVAVVYGEDGGVLDRAEAAAWLAPAMQDWERGRMLRRALLRREQWRSVSTDLWFDFFPTWLIWQSRWSEGRRRHHDWQRHHDRPGAIRWRHRYDGEHHRRRGLAEQFARWKLGGFQGTPPGNYTRPPGGWGHGRPGHGDGRPGHGDGRPGHGDGRPGHGDGRPGHGQPGGQAQGGTGTTPLQPGHVRIPLRNGATGVMPAIDRDRPRREGGYRPRPSETPPIELTEPVPVTTSPNPAPAVTPRPRPIGRDWTGGRPPRIERPAAGSGAPLPPVSGSPAPPPTVAPQPRPIERDWSGDRRPRFERPRTTDSGSPPPPPSYTPPASSYSSPAPATAPRPRPVERNWSGDRPARFERPASTPAPSYTPPERAYTPPPSPPVRAYTPPPAPVVRSYSPPPPPPAPVVRSYSPPPPPPPPPPERASPPPSRGDRTYNHPD